MRTKCRNCGRHIVFYGPERFTTGHPNGQWVHGFTRSTFCNKRGSAWLPGDTGIAAPDDVPDEKEQG